MGWPFQNPFAPGLATNDVPTAAQMNLLGSQQAQSASGVYYSDVAVVANILHHEEDIEGGGGVYTLGGALLWEPTTGRWWNFGRNSSNNSAGFAAFPLSAWGSSTLDSDTSGITNWTASKSADHNNAGRIVVGGNANNASKIRVSADAGDTWAAANTVESTSCAVDALKWAPSAGLFVAGTSRTVTTNIETSPDGVTWTQRTAPNSHARREAAANATRIVVIAATSTNKCITSEDGITWTERTLPATADWKSITWNAERGLFMVVDGTNVATSPDGITWSAVVATVPVGFTGKLRAFGRLWVAHSGVVQVSANDGVSWKIYGSAAGKMECSGQQFLFANVNDAKRTLYTGS